MLQWVCRSALQSAFPSFRSATISAVFYPYIGLTHTIRRKESEWVLRISDHCRNAPRQVLEAIAIILGSKIVHKRPPQGLVETYESFRQASMIEAAVRERRRVKGRKRISMEEGVHYSLPAIYREINNHFFNGQIEIQQIGWGLRKGWRRLGHYDPIHHSITLSPALDSPKVPEFVVRYIVYHEMLHAIFEDQPDRGARQRHHPPEFHRAERSHPDYARSKKFLREFFGRRRRRMDD
jgi:hypothetical protein